jgi:hypothetical protein
MIFRTGQAKRNRRTGQPRARLDPGIIEEVKARLSLIELVREDGHELRRSGNHAVCVCPFHEDRTASFNVWNDHAHCFGCTVHIGDVIDYRMRTRGCDFRTAVEQLAAIAGVAIPVVGTARPAPSKPRPPAPPNPPEVLPELDRAKRKELDKLCQRLADDRTREHHRTDTSLHRRRTGASLQAIRHRRRSDCQGAEGDECGQCVQYPFRD